MQPPRGKRGLALRALLDGATVTAAATAAGVDRATVWRWFQEDDFVQALRGGSATALTAAARRLQVATGDAVTVLLNTMHDGTTPGTAARLRAAGMVLDHASKLVELVDILPRLEALENRQ